MIFGLQCGVLVMSKKHELKCWSGFFNLVWEGVKTFEYRVDDRQYNEGDDLVVRDWDKDKSEYRGRYYTAKVGYVLHCATFDGSTGWVILSLLDVKKFDSEFVPPSGEHTGCRCPNCPERQSPKQECECCKSTRLADKCGCQ